eukprot:2470779-Amphidinium_carterae.1
MSMRWRNVEVDYSQRMANQGDPSSSENAGFRFNEGVSHVNNLRSQLNECANIFVYAVAKNCTQ